MTAAAREDSGETAGKTLEQCVRTRIVAARSEKDVVAAQQIREPVGRKRPDDTNPFECRLRVPGEGELEGVGVEVPVKPGTRLDAHLVPAAAVGMLAELAFAAGRLPLADDAPLYLRTPDVTPSAGKKVLR